MSNDSFSQRLRAAGLGLSGPFVGRERELAELWRLFDSVSQGRGAVALVVGEPGIGKTALCSEFASRTVGAGADVLVGHCYGEGSSSLPYLPFVEALRTHILDRDPEVLREELGEGASDVARLVPETRARLDVVPRPAGDPDEDRWRLLQAVTVVLQAAGASRPLVLVLEDLHWADRGTLDLLLHVARGLATSKVLLLLTYRDVEVGRAHPLSDALVELRRIGSLTRIGLRGLAVDEVHRLHRELRGDEAQRAQSEAVHDRTEGNPLFVQEVLRDLSPAASTSEALIPEGLKEAIGHRLSRLSAECNHLLNCAAVIGRDFDLRTLQAVAGQDEAVLTPAIEEAAAAGVIEEQSRPGSIAYRFAHALFRETLYEELSAPRRLRLHQQIGRTLEEQHAGRLEDHAGQLAEHFAQSTDPDDLAKAVTYGEIAARRAVAVFAYSEAVRLLRRALDVQDTLDPNDAARRCDLLLSQAEAMLSLDQPVQVVSEVAPECFRLAETLGDAERAARIAVLALESLHGAGWAGTAATPEQRALHRDWVARADRVAQPGTRERTLVDLHAALGMLQAGELERGRDAMRPVAQQALSFQDNALFLTIAGVAMNFLISAPDDALTMELAQEVRRRPREGTRSLFALRAAGLKLLESGDRDTAEALWRDQALYAQHTLDRALALGARALPIRLAFLDGELAKALAMYESLHVEAVEAGVFRWINDDQLRYYLGTLDEGCLASWTGPNRLIRAVRALRLAWLGRLDEARGIEKLFGDLGQSDGTAVLNLVNLLQTAVLLPDASLAEVVSRRLQPLADSLHFATAHGLGVSIARCLGEAAELLGRPQQARDYYERGIVACTRIRFRPELAITRLLLAGLLLRHFPVERQSATSHLDFAIAELEAMGMRPYLERAQALRLEPPARAAVPAYPDGLSEREVEVLLLIAQGRTNRQIAEALVLSINTVQRHVSNILAKASLNNRAEAVNYAHRNKLT